MGNLRPFQIVLLAVFAALGVGAIILLGAYQASISQSSRIYGDQVIIWGPFDERVMLDFFEEISRDNRAFEVVDYYQVDARDFESQLVNAIAENRGPDMIIVSSEQIVTLRPKLTPISFETLPLRTIKDWYVDGVELFTFPEGTYALPFAVDPLMLYWNRDLFAASGLAQAPATWEALVNRVVPSLATVDMRRNVLQSALAFGEYRNLTNPKAVLLMLAMQSGSRMVYLENGQYQVALDTPASDDVNVRPLELALEFFTEFSNSNSPLYTWNRVQPNDQNAFVAGDLAMYFGFASEYQQLIDKNPNLNFDVTVVPQGESATIRRTYGHFYGFAIPQTSYNPNGAYQAALTLTNELYAKGMAESLGMVSPFRSIIAAGADNPAQQSAMNAALYARGWYDPDIERTNSILQALVESVVSNRERITTAVKQATGQIANEFGQR